MSIKLWTDARCSGWECRMNSFRKTSIILELCKHFPCRVWCPEKKNAIFHLVFLFYFLLGVGVEWIFLGVQRLNQSSCLESIAPMLGANSLCQKNHYLPQTFTKKTNTKLDQELEERQSRADSSVYKREVRQAENILVMMLAQLYCIHSGSSLNTPELAFATPHGCLSEKPSTWGVKLVQEGPE